MGNLVNCGDLGLSGNQLSGSIPSELGNLVELWVLDLSGNQLSGSIPSELGNLGNLRNLYLDSNQLNGSIPSELGKLVNLRELHLSGNQLSGPLPRSLMGLHLSVFHFGDTHLCEPPDAAFQAWLATIPDLERNGLVCSVVYLPLCLR